MNKIQEAIKILTDLGVPRAQRNERSALTLLALAGIARTGSWGAAKKQLLRTVDIMNFMRNKYNKNYAPNSRETIRRQTLHQFEQARIVDRNPDNPTRPTNSGNTVYAITDEALQTIQTVNSKNWKKSVSAFKKMAGSLSEEYAKSREINKIPVILSDGKEFRLSPGAHNKLQTAVINEFAPRFAAGTTLLYFGDTSRKQLVCNDKLLTSIGIKITAHDKLPDMIFYNPQKNWLFLIEVATTHGPVSPKRYKEIEAMLVGCNAYRTYITAFPDFTTFKKYAQDIVWESEVWVASNPDHMIHFNGNKFFGPRS